MSGESFWSYSQESAREVALIVDLSHPKGASVNDGIELELCSLSYTSVDAAVGIITAMGPGVLLEKFDIESAYTHAFSVCTTLAPRPMTVVFVTAYAHVYIIRKWRPTQQTAAEQCCNYQGKFEAMMSLSGCEAVVS